jgi:hypothetical protein
MVLFLYRPYAIGIPMGLDFGFIIVNIATDI